jgi:hypothetical protein
MVWPELMVVGDVQLLAVTQVPFTETAADCAMKGTAKTSAIGSTAFKKHAQNGRGFKRPAERPSEFLSSLAARSRALCAFKKLRSRVECKQTSHCSKEFFEFSDGNRKGHVS